MSKMILTLIFDGSWFLPKNEIKLEVKSLEHAQELTNYHEKSTKAILLKAYVTVTAE